MIRFGRRRVRRWRLSLGVLAVLSSALGAEPWLAPGSVALRHDLLELADAGLLAVPLTTWPVPWAGIAAALDTVDRAALTPDGLAALLRVEEHARRETRSGDLLAHARLGGIEDPRLIRPFEALPRAEAEATGGLRWTGDRLAFRLNATRVRNPSDGEETRFDGSYIGAVVGNWTLSAGFQERWWGPGWEGSLILSSNARPTPQIALERLFAEPFQTRWLRWIGPWSFSTFMGELDDERTIDGARLFGMRFTMKPAADLELGFSRTAQWCGEGRPCDLEAFGDLLLGRDNRGVNVDAEEEPGNQLAGMDVRWSSPWGTRPYALYFQWIGEDTRQGGPQIGSWLRQAGVEVWGGWGNWRQRTHIELADTVCREGGLGFGQAKYHCAYEHGVYQTGYRYEGRVIGHGAEGDANMQSLGSTWIHTGTGAHWNALLSRAELNEQSSATNTLTPVARTLTEIHVSREQSFGFATIRGGIGYQRLSGGAEASDGGYVLWLELVRD
jgi:hypothetical protein